MRYKILITILSLSLSLLLLSSCTEKPETTPESVLPGEESGTLSPTGDETGEPDPAGEPESGTEPESETEPAAAKDRMKKLVREESELLQAELQAEKETDPVFDMDTAPDPEKTARLEEVKKRLAELRERQDEKGLYPEEDREEAESLALEEETLELSIPLRSDMRALAVRNYPKYAYFYQVLYSLRGVDIPGGVRSPYQDYYDLERKAYFVHPIEYLGNRGMNPQSILDLGPDDETNVIFSGRVVERVKEEKQSKSDADQGILILEVTEVFWGGLEAGDLVGFRYGLYENEIPDAENYLFFVWSTEETSYDGKTIPLTRGFSYCVYEIREDGTLFAASSLRDASRLDGLTPEEGVKLVLRNYMKYYKALDSAKPLSAD